MDDYALEWEILWSATTNAERFLKLLGHDERIFNNPDAREVFRALRVIRDTALVPDLPTIREIMRTKGVNEETVKSCMMNMIKAYTNIVNFDFLLNTLATGRRKEDMITFLTAMTQDAPGMAIEEIRSTVMDYFGNLSP